MRFRILGVTCLSSAKLGARLAECRIAASVVAVLITRTKPPERSFKNEMVYRVSANPYFFASLPSRPTSPHSFSNIPTTLSDSDSNNATATSNGLAITLLIQVDRTLRGSGTPG